MTPRKRSHFDPNLLMQTIQPPHILRQRGPPTFACREASTGGVSGGGASVENV
jgi:hypothetical protein